MRGKEKGERTEEIRMEEKLKQTRRESSQRSLPDVNRYMREIML